MTTTINPPAAGVPQLPSFPRKLPLEVEQSIYRAVKDVWRTLSPYRTADGPSEADKELAAQLLVFLHTVQPSEADAVAYALRLLMDGATEVASSCGPEGDHWAEWGLATD